MYKQRIKELTKEIETLKRDEIMSKIVNLDIIHPDGTYLCCACKNEVGKCLTCDKQIAPNNWPGCCKPYTSVNFNMVSQEIKKPPWLKIGFVCLICREKINRDSQVTIKIIKRFEPQIYLDNLAHVKEL